MWEKPQLLFRRSAAATRLIVEHITTHLLQQTSFCKDDFRKYAHVFKYIRVSFRLRFILMRTFSLVSLRTPNILLSYGKYSEDRGYFFVFSTRMKTIAAYYGLNASVRIHRVVNALIALFSYNDGGRQTSYAVFPGLS